MKNTPWMLVALLALCAALAALPAAAVAQQVTEDGDTSVSTEVVIFESSDEIERWWGVAGAAICGAELWLLRNRPDIGINPYVLAAGIAGCALALLDVATT